jgi:hypothetical protein
MSTPPPARAERTMFHASAGQVAVFATKALVMLCAGDCCATPRCGEASIPAANARVVTIRCIRKFLILRPRPCASLDVRRQNVGRAPLEP